MNKDHVGVVAQLVKEGAEAHALYLRLLGEADEKRREADDARIKAEVLIERCKQALEYFDDP